jgi:two-component system, NarL family, nitrate/nitrite sensor histidine kinase NarX
VNQFDLQKLTRISSKLVSYIPWVIALIGGLLVFSLLLIQTSFLRIYSDNSIWLSVGIGITFGGILYYLSRSILWIIDDRGSLIQKLAGSEKKAMRASQNLSQLIGFSEKLSKAKEEKEIINTLVQSCIEVSGSIGCSYVAFDDLGLPMVAESFGDYPASVISSWTDYLATPAVRQRCQNCDKSAYITEACPLLASPFSETFAMYCLPLKRFGREIGVLNLYLRKDQEINENTQRIMSAMLGETGMALEVTHLRQEKMEALSQIQSLRNKIDLDSQLRTVLKQAIDALESDFAVVFINNQESGKSDLTVSVGDYFNPTNIPVDQLWRKSFDPNKGKIVSEISGETYSMQGTSSTIISPLKIEDSPLYGVIIIGSNKQNSYNRSQLEYVEAMALLVSILVRNSNIQAELEFNAMMAERTRLAREIHDGLAQTLGFLKMQSIQMQNNLTKGDIPLVQQSLDTFLKILKEVYQETRQSIDGLRISPSDSSVIPWLEQIAEDFQENCGLNVELIDIDCIDKLAPEVQAQLIRILQEALSNVRKHAKATHVWIACSKNDDDLILEVRDDGIGFSPGDIPDPSRYGLLIMQERSDLINADFQVISKPLDGATIRLRLPLDLGIKTG